MRRQRMLNTNYKYTFDNPMFVKMLVIMLFCCKMCKLFDFKNSIIFALIILLFHRISFFVKSVGFLTSIIANYYYYCIYYIINYRTYSRNNPCSGHPFSGHPFSGHPFSGLIFKFYVKLF